MLEQSQNGQGIEAAQARFGNQPGQNTVRRAVKRHTAGIIDPNLPSLQFDGNGFPGPAYSFDFPCAIGELETKNRQIGYENGTLPTFWPGQVDPDLKIKVEKGVLEITSDTKIKTGLPDSVFLIRWWVADRPVKPIRMSGHPIEELHMLRSAHTIFVVT